MNSMELIIVLSIFVKTPLGKNDWP